MPNELTIDAPTAEDVFYEIQPNPAGVTPALTVSPAAVSQTVAGCTLTTTLEFYDENLNAWVPASPIPSFAAFVTSVVGATFTIDTEDEATWDDFDEDPTVVKARWITEDPLSETSSRLVEDYFDITVYYKCDAD